MILVLLKVINLQPSIYSSISSISCSILLVINSLPYSLYPKRSYKRSATKSGTKARFLVGGEFPIAVSGVAGGNVEWKEYGIIMEILPKILPEDKIDIVIETELSRLDWANAVQGLPNVAKRQARSNVILKNQQTIVIAGLIENYKDKKTSGIPILSDIPILGTLFKNTKVMDNKTNVLIFVKVFGAYIFGYWAMSFLFGDLLKN